MASWQEEALRIWRSWHSATVGTADKWLDHAAAFDLTSTTTTEQLSLASWSDEWNYVKAFFFDSWSDRKFLWKVLMDAIHDAATGIQSVLFLFWVTLRPLLYSITYISGRVAQSLLGKLLPTIQYGTIGFLRFHLHLTWVQALGEVAIITFLVASWKFVRYLQKQKYLQRSRKFLRQKSRQMTKAIQTAYREVADVSLLFAMAIPHAGYVGLVVTIKVLFPSSVSWLASETIAPSLLKWWYPLAATIGVLHHARAFTTNDAGALDDDEHEAKSSSSANHNKGKKEGSKNDKTKSKRRRSSLGDILRRSVHGHKAESQENGDNEEMVYTEEEMHEDVNYWLHFWALRASLEAIHALVSRFLFVGSFLTSVRVQTVLDEVQLVFYIWIFLLPQCLMVLFPSSVEEERRDWSAAKQWCYECALQPVLAIPMLFKPLVVPFFEKVSQAIPAREWRRLVVDKLQYLSGALVMLRIITEHRRDAIMDCIADFHTRVLPALLLFSPGFITQYGVWYVQYIVPLAYSFHALQHEHRRLQRVLYLKFWILHGLTAVLVFKILSIFWWFPLSTHLAFIVWIVLVMPRVTNFLYHELDRELQALGFLPPVAGDLAVERTHTFRALSFIAATLPSASDTIEKKVDSPNDEGKETQANANTSNHNGNENGEKAARGTTLLSASDTVDTPNDEGNEPQENNDPTSNDNRTEDVDKTSHGGVNNDSNDFVRDDELEHKKVPKANTQQQPDSGDDQEDLPDFADDDQDDTTTPPANCKGKAAEVDSSVRRSARLSRK